MARRKHPDLRRVFHIRLSNAEYADIERKALFGKQEQEKLDAALIVRQQERHKENILLRVIDERLKLHARELTIQLEHEISDIWMAGHYEYFDSEPRRS